MAAMMGRGLSKKRQICLYATCRANFISSPRIHRGEWSVSQTFEGPGKGAPEGGTAAGGKGVGESGDLQTGNKVRQRIPRRILQWHNDIRESSSA